MLLYPFLIALMLRSVLEFVVIVNLSFVCGFVDFVVGVCVWWFVFSYCCSVLIAILYCYDDNVETLCFTLCFDCYLHCCYLI